MFESVVINLMGVPADLCSVFLFSQLLPRKKERLFWITQVTGILAVRMFRTFVDASLGWMGIPIVLLGVVLVAEGPLFRRVLATAVGFVVMAAGEIPVGILWLSLTHTELVSVTNAFTHLPVFALLQAIYCVIIIFLAVMITPFARQFAGAQGSSRTSVAVAIFPVVHGVLITCCLRCLTFAPTWTTYHFLGGLVIVALSVVSTVLIMLDTQSSIEKTSADLAAEAIMRSADGFLRHYEELERSIELSAMIRHDIKNQWGVISELVAHDEKDHALQLVTALKTEAEQASIATEDTSADTGAAEKDLVVEADGASQEGELPLKKELPADSQQTEGNVLSAGQTRRAANSPAVFSTVQPLLTARRSYRAARAFYLVSYAALVAGFIFLLRRASPTMAQIVIGVVSVVIGTLVLPPLFKMLREAHEADVAAERLRAAESVLLARRRYGERLEAESAEASRIRQEMIVGLAELERLLREGDDEKIMRHLETSGARPAASVRWCDHKVVSMLTDIKSQAAKAAGVGFEASIDLPDDVSIPALDLCAVFSNMLDNAIEAARGAEGDARRVRVVAGGRGGYLVVRTENGLPEGARPQRLRVQRPGIGEHGWGLRVLAEFARRHDGELMTGVEGGAFVSQVTLRLGE